MSPLAEKLQRLLRLATLLPHEEADAARENEARTAAWLLLREVQKHGVKISFKLPEVASSSGRVAEGVSHTVTTEARSRSSTRVTRNGHPIDMADFINFVEQDLFVQRARDEVNRKRRARAGAIVKSRCMHAGTVCESCGVKLDVNEVAFVSADGRFYTHERCGPEALL